MTLPKNPIIAIPARMAATRLPDKPLADINGKPMIIHVWERSVKADIAPVIVAAGDQEIVDVVEAAGGKAVLTDPALPSGTDRVHAAVAQIDPDQKYDAVLNVQGDLPGVEPELIQAVFKGLEKEAADIATPVVEIKEEWMKDDPTVAKAIISFDGTGKSGKALYFTRANAPTGEGPRYSHMGLYAFRRPALEKYVTLPMSLLEKQEKFEQLRAVEAGMHIEAVVVDRHLPEVNNDRDLQVARELL